MYPSPLRRSWLFEYLTPAPHRHSHARKQTARLHHLTRIRQEREVKVGAQQTLTSAPFLPPSVHYFLPNLQPSFTTYSTTIRRYRSRRQPWDPPYPPPHPALASPRRLTHHPPHPNASKTSPCPHGSAPERKHSVISPLPLPHPHPHLHLLHPATKTTNRQPPSSTALIDTASAAGAPGIEKRRKKSKTPSSTRRSAVRIWVGGRGVSIHSSSLRKMRRVR